METFVFFALVTIASVGVATIGYLLYTILEGCEEVARTCQERRAAWLAEDYPALVPADPCERVRLVVTPEVEDHHPLEALSLWATPCYCGTHLKCSLH